MFMIRRTSDYADCIKKLKDIRAKPRIAARKMTQIAQSYWKFKSLSSHESWIERFACCAHLMASSNGIGLANR